MTLILSLGISAWTKVGVSSETQELTYEDLLSELNSSRSKFKKDAYHPYDDLLIHAGIGFVSTFSNVGDKSWQQSGLELSIGADLFSNQWYTQGSFRNYGIATQGRAELSLKQLDFKIGYRDQIQKPWHYHLGVGLSTRSLKYSDPGLKNSQDETSPAFLGFGGVTAQVSQVVGLGFELGGRSPFVNSSLDHGSLELGLILGISI